MQHSQLLVERVIYENKISVRAGMTSGLAIEKKNVTFISVLGLKCIK